jgi:hypothetical protein
MACDFDDVFVETGSTGAVTHLTKRHQLAAADANGSSSSRSGDGLGWVCSQDNRRVLSVCTRKTPPRLWQDKRRTARAKPTKNLT